MMDAVALLKDVGVIPSEGLSGAAWRSTDRTEAVVRINRRLREILESAESDPDVIDRVTDAVIAESLPELARMEADIVQP